MSASFFSAIVTLVVCAAVFSCFGAVVGYLYIADRRRARLRAAAARDAAEERRRRRRARFPDALPGPNNLHDEPPVLGNVLIKDERTLAMLQHSLIAVDVPASALRSTPVTAANAPGNSSAAACSAGHEDDFVEVLDTSEMAADEGRSVTVPTAATTMTATTTTTASRQMTSTPADNSAVSPRAPQRNFHHSLLDGGYVIVECAVPASLSISGGSRSEASPLSSVGPRDEEEEAVAVEEQETAPAAKASITQYFRFQRSSSPYGTSQYLPHK